MKIRKFWLVLLFLALSLTAAHAQAYPARSITIVVPFGPGGPTDTVARIMGERMRVSLGQPVVVENVSGASGSIGAGRVARATPDGYTLVVGQWSSHVGAGAIYKLPYDQHADFAPVALLTSSPLWIIGRKDIPANTLRELIAWIKARPGKVTAGTVGVGSGTHLCLVYFQNQTGTEFQVVPYRGGPPMMQDIIGGQVDISCPESSQNLGQYRSGAIKVFAVMAKQRWSAAPDVPSTEEAGVPGLQFPFWNALWAPKSTPESIIRRLNSAVVEAFEDPAVRKRFSELGYDIPARDQLTPEALSKWHKAEIEKWFPIIRAANIRTEN
ncbi:MAG: tripartite tricarboxylate transporter substrate binding protein BugD [Hyphomicrobiales bacterium]|nr:tripartite tricarboxylate transporter substrate binding protein BugD [Hyphomicrobiales bacterium]